MKKLLELTADDLPKYKKLTKIRSNFLKFAKKEYPELPYEDMIMYVDGLTDGYLYRRKEDKAKKRKK
jgi:hypothetical protein